MSLVDGSQKTPPTKSTLFGWWPKPNQSEKRTRHLIAILVWAYAILNLFVFDVDAHLMARLPPNISWIIQFKLFFFIGGAALLAMFVSTPRLLAWIIYITFYPISRFTIFSLYAAILIIKTKSWPIIFSALNIVLSFFKTFKPTFIILSGTIVCSAVVFISQSAPSLYSVAALMVIIVGVLVIRRFISLFRPSQLLKTYAVVMSTLLNFTRNNYAPDPASKAIQPSQMDAKQRDKWASNLQTTITLRTLCEYLSIKFSDYRKSGLPILYYILNFVLLSVAVIYLFAMISDALFRANNHSFAITNGHTLFDFVYYSFNTLVFQRIPDITPVSFLARSAWMMETVVALALVGMFGAIYFAFKRTLDEEGIQEVIETLRNQASAIDTFVQSEYSLSLDGAISQLESAQKSVSVWLGLLRSARGGDTT